MHYSIIGLSCCPLTIIELYCKVRFYVYDRLMCKSQMAIIKMASKDRFSNDYLIAFKNAV